MVRLHRPLLAAQKLPPSRVARHIWEQRFEDIHGFERHLWRNGTIIRKFYLHISRGAAEASTVRAPRQPSEELEVLKADLLESGKWHAYREAYEEALAATSHHHAPWYVVPADHKWFAQVLMADIVVEAFENLDLSFPKLSASQRRALAKAHRTLGHQR